MPLAVLTLGIFLSSLVSVKWQKEVFPDVEIDTSQPPLVFKGQLYDLTGVPPERQKIMVKGGLLKVFWFLHTIFSRSAVCSCIFSFTSLHDIWLKVKYSAMQDDADWGTLGVRQVISLITFSFWICFPNERVQ